MNVSPLYLILEEKNNIYIKREDLLEYSMGGNKLRKALNFFEEIDKGGYDTVVTYGSSSSNHGRIVANMAKSRGLDCIIISPAEAAEITFNSQMMGLFGSEIIISPVDQVSATIDETIFKLELSGKKPYFIQGGGHGYLGTKAYVTCYDEIRAYEKKTDVNFDYIFLASGTGATQAGLICGMLINEDKKKIVGISIARKIPRGREVIVESVKEYFELEGLEIGHEKIDQATIFTDKYICGGYGKYDRSVEETINNLMVNYGIASDPTYTAKAFTGMKKYLDENNIISKNILFIHTGGTPLYFEYLNKLRIGD